MITIISVNTARRPDWMDAAGLSKGVDHDKYPMNFVLKAGAVISVRETLPRSGLMLTLECLNNDSETEHTLDISDAWQQQQVSAPSALFIRTPYFSGSDGPSTVNIEIEVDEDQTTGLPIYRYLLDDTRDFFSKWDSYNAPFALVITPYTQILVPTVDRSRMRASFIAVGLDVLADYYNGIFELFNTLLGVSFDSPQPIHQNVPNRYFMKADAHGAGSAYYGLYWTAQTSTSTYEFWLDTAPTNWGSVHEIAHGYQLTALNNATVSLAEVWNNIYAHFYQLQKLGASIYELGALYEIRDGLGIHERVTRYIDNATPLNAWDLFAKLYFMVSIVLKSGTSSFTLFNRLYRERMNEQNAVEPSLMDFITETFQRHARIDLVAYLNLCGVDFSDRKLAVASAYSGCFPVLPAQHLISTRYLPSVIDGLELEGPLALVDTRQLATQSQLPVDASLDIAMNEGDFADSTGKDLIFRNGTNISLIHTVSAKAFTLRLPPGVYAVQHPGVEGKCRTPDTCYVAVQESAANSLTFGYFPNAQPALASQTIILKGVGDATFCRVSVDFFSNRLSVDVISTTPHYFFEDEYARVEILGADGQSLLLHSINGARTELFHWATPSPLGCVIGIYHRESQSRLSVEPGQSLINHNNVNHTFAVAETGLVNPSLNNNPLVTLEAEMDKAALSLDDQPHTWLHPHHPTKAYIRHAISFFPIDQQAGLTERYRYLAPFDNTENALAFSGTQFLWSLSGPNDSNVAEVRINLAAGSVSVAVTETTPHPDILPIYIAVWIRRGQINTLYSQEFSGAEVAIPGVFSSTFGPGDSICVLHMDAPTHSVLTNELTNEQLPTDVITIMRYRNAGEIEITHSHP